MAAFIDGLIQAVSFLAAAYFQTEKFFDIVGASTFVVVLIQSVLSSRVFSPRQVCCINIE